MTKAIRDSSVWEYYNSHSDIEPVEWVAPLSPDESHALLTSALDEGDITLFFWMVVTGASRADEACIAALMSDRVDIALAVLDDAMVMPDCDVDGIVNVADACGEDDFLADLIDYYYVR